MPTIPSSQERKPTGYTQAQLHARVQNLVTRSMSLKHTISRLQRSPSDDPIQQLQTNAIIGIYEAVKEIQILDPLTALLPSL